jgi:hypothetical protein
MPLLVMPPKELSVKDSKDKESIRLKLNGASSKLSLISRKFKPGLTESDRKDIKFSYIAKLNKINN